MNTELVAPVIVNALMLSGSMPVFETCNVVVVMLFSGCRPKARVAGAAIVAGVAAVPLTVATTV